ncbi:di-trans,poly-cis-decaprenylcistransferase [Candidatus Dependentiae bacterium]|nr:di-trans,poly-cis-decaprenylcistransferase [Candidatus Dependentiae bacterium]
MISHLALIMDGNRRWAKKRALLPWIGHKQGVESVQMVVQYCLDYHIPYLSLYTFSLENFKRTEKEISYLFSLLDEAKDRINEFVDAQVKIRFVGDLSKLSIATKAICEEIEQATKFGKKLECNFLMCYGGQQEIVAAIQKIVIENQQISNVDDFRSYLWLGNVPDPEIIIRTGGVKRLSNFLLFQAAYAEIRFLDCLWPDLTKEMLHKTILDCLNSQKNFGK